MFKVDNGEESHGAVALSPSPDMSAETALPMGRPLTTSAVTVLALEVLLLQHHDLEFFPWGPSAPSKEDFLPCRLSGDSLAQP